MNKFIFAIIASSVASTAYAAPTTISLGGPSSPGINWGNTHVFTSGALTVTAKGFTAANAATALYGKNGGAGETGLGLTNDPSGDNEIYYGKGYVQLDVSALFGLVSSVSFTTNSTTDGEQWSIFGSNTSASYGGTALLSGTNQNSAFLPSFGSYKYYDFVSTSASGGKNFLIASLTMTPVPEPATWAMMLVGFGGIGMTMRRRRVNLRRSQIA